MSARPETGRSTGTIDPEQSVGFWASTSEEVRPSGGPIEDEDASGPDNANDVDVVLE
jgi:hypothetical protein